MTISSPCWWGLWWGKSSLVPGRSSATSNCRTIVWPSGISPRRLATPTLHVRTHDLLMWWTSLVSHWAEHDHYDHPNGDANYTRPHLGQGLCSCGKDSHNFSSLFCCFIFCILTIFLFIEVDCRTLQSTWVFVVYLMIITTTSYSSWPSFLIHHRSPLIDIDYIWHNLHFVHFSILCRSFAQFQWVMWRQYERATSPKCCSALLMSSQLIDASHWSSVVAGATWTWWPSQPRKHSPGSVAWKSWLRTWRTWGSERN